MVSSSEPVSHDVDVSDLRMSQQTWFLGGGCLWYFSMQLFSQTDLRDIVSDGDPQTNK